MLVEIFEGLFAVAVLVAVCQSFRLSYWRDMAESRWEIYEEVLDRALEAEAELGRTIAEIAFIKQSVLQLATRSTVAILDDTQAEKLIEAIGMLVTNAIQDPNRIN